MDKKFKPEKHRMMLCPVCDGYGRIRCYLDDVKVCQNCGGFGFIRGEGKTFNHKSYDTQK
jgi:DnaJ-class molecular chaperone